MTPASFAVRTGAALIDIVIVGFLSWLLLIPVQKLAHLDRLQAQGDDLNRKMQQGVMFDISDLQPLLMGLFLLFIALLVLLILMHVYYVYFEASTGQTPGKRILGLRVVTLEGGQITKKQAVYREMLRWYVDGLFILPAVISMAMTPRRQRVGDLAAETMVVVVPKGTAPTHWP